MNYKFAVLALSLVLSQSSHALYGARLLSKADALNAVVSLHLNDVLNPDYDYFCSGVLVKPNVILTAGHCIEGMGVEVYDNGNVFNASPELLKVKINGQHFAVATVTLAPTYAERVGFAGEDLALITLKKKTSVTPFKILPWFALKVKTAALMVAHGKVAETSITTVKTYSGNTVIHTDGSKAGICRGDSGGALLVKSGNEFVLAGILNAQDSEACERRTGVSVYARIFE